MEAINVLIKENLCGFVQKHGDNRLKRELLIFWGMHPNTRFDSKVISYALDCFKLDAERALRAMVTEGLVDSYTSNGVSLYSLTKNEDRRQPIIELATLGWDRWQLMIKHIELYDKVANC